MLIVIFPIYAQTPWYLIGNNPLSTDYFGTNNNEPIRIRTNNTLRGLFTTGNALGSGSTLGDGLRIVDPLVGGPGNLDMWTSGSTQTHIKWDGSGLIQGVSSRFEMIGNYNGLWFNTTGGTGRYIFNRTSGETGRIGVNNFWRIGLNALDIDANRRLETFDNTNPQLRLTSVSNATLSLGVWTDFQTTSLGNLYLNPRNSGAGVM